MNTLNRLNRYLKGGRAIADQRGMTLIEIMVVVAILGMMMTIITVAYVRYLDQSKVDGTKIQMANVVQALDEAGIPAGDELILRRVNSTDGRKTAWVNDRRVSGEVLRALSEHLVELHGQHDDRGLLNPRGHRDLLDAGSLAQEFSVPRERVSRCA